MFTQPEAATSEVRSRARIVVAALLSLFLVIAGALTAPPARALVDGAVITGTVTAASESGLTVQVQASGLGSVTSAYAALIPKGAEAGVSGSGGYAAFALPFPTVSGGATSFTLTAAKTALDRSITYEVLIWQIHSGANAETIYARSDVAISTTQWDAVFPPAPEPEPAVATSTTLTVDPASTSQAGATFTLGATVSPAASGTVAYSVNGSSVGSAPVGSTVTTSVATPGTAQLSAVFTPADPAAFVGSTSSSVAYEITAVTTPEEPETPVFTPAISVFRADGTTPFAGTVTAGETLVVKGTGFDPAANVGGRGLPIPATLPQGTYVVFGHFAENWKPSAGAASAQRKVISQKWALAESVLEQVPAQYQATIRGQWVDIAADGSFRATLTASETTAPVSGGAYGVYTYGAGGVSNAAQELSVPVAFAPVFDPAISVFRADGTTPVTGTVDAGETLVVKGTGFDPAANVGGRGVPIPSTLPQGTYVVFGQFAENWKPSAGAASSQRKVGSQKWALAEGVLDQVPSAYQASIRSQWAALSADGSFSTTLTVTETAAVDTGRYGVYTYGAGGVSNADQELYVPLTIAPPVPDPSLDVAVTAVDAVAGATIRVEGANLGSATGAYAAIIEKGAEAGVGMGGGYVAFAIPFPVITNGATDITFTAPTAELDPAKTYEVLVWKQHSVPDATTIYARADVPFTAEHWKVLFPETTPPPTAPPITPPTDPQTPAASGSLRWSISSTFTGYVAGSIAKGSVAVSGGATRSGGLFQFGQATGSTFDADAGTGSVSYIGAVRFTGHGGILDVTISNPQIRATSPTSAALYVTSGGSQVHFADLNLGAATRSTAGGAVTFEGAPATLTAAGRTQVFQGYSTSLDPIAFTVGSVGLAPSGSTGTVAAAPAPARSAVPATPPAAEGIVLDDATLAALSAGEQVEVSASGFQPNEEGILVVVYSTPIVLDELTADATGTATWSGSLPATLADGEHTLTFQGSVDRGIRFTLARAAAALDGCLVEGASLNWGFKETFRTYIEGIAAGGWELADVVYEYPEFVWADGTGAVDIDARTGLVTYGGSIRFTGHSGALDTTLANARLELAGDTGYLVFDVSGTTQAGEPVSEAGVRFAEFALPDLELTDQGLVLDALPATLTDAGAAAFGTYPAGEELDPVSALIPVDEACGEPVAVPDDAPVAEAEVERVDAVQAQDSAPVWPWAVGGIAVVLVIGAAAWVVIARRRAAHADS
ncbi:MAG: HtaA domain-containing protein [Microbacterium sp.]